MLGLLMRYYLYLVDNSHDLDADLMFLNVVPFECAHMTYIDRQGHHYYIQGQHVFTSLMRK